MIRKNFLLLSILLFVSLSVFAGKEKYNGRLTNEGTGSSALVSGSSVIVEDPQYKNYVQNSLSWPMNFKDVSVRNRVILKINQESTRVQTGTGPCSVTVNITYTSFNGSTFVPLTITNKVLEINPATIKEDKIVFDFAGGNNLRVDVVSVSPATGYNLALEAEMEIERFYSFNPDVAYSGYLSHCSGEMVAKGELEIFWEPMIGAEEYDLEWVFVNNYGDLGIQSEKAAAALLIDENLFRFNSTRISTANTFYKIPYLYERGYILYRVRGVGRNNLDNYSSLISGKWSSDGISPFPANVAGFPNKFPDQSVNNGGTCNSAEIPVTHEQKLNWQSSVSYAEDGKSKAVVSYMDGSLHGRQSVTKIKSNDEVIVGETIYDHEGRPAINVLPVPANSGKIDYKHSFNTISPGVPYTKTNFDLGTFCTATTPPMDGTSGAAAYYGPNTQAQNEDKVIPTSQGYPFTQVEYTPDNTGRINAQSGVGPTHQLNSNHETKYIYGTPFQENLDRLFGSEAGNANRYKQNMVIDANGQSSISYIAPDGKVVATSLAGNAPTNTQSLQSNIGTENATNMTIDLINKVRLTDNSGLNNTIDQNNGTIVLQETFPVAAEGPYTFNYEVRPAIFDSSCSVTHQIISGLDPLAVPPAQTFSVTPQTVQNQFCYNCVYDLTISLKDECGTELVNTIKHAGTPLTNKALVGNKSDDCNVPQINFSSDGDFNINNPSASNPINLKPGSYSLTKSLNLNEAVLEEYANAYLQSNNNCLLTLTDFYSQSLAEADFSGCDIDCAECLTQLGTYDKYSGLNCTTCLTVEQYQVLVDDCNEQCNYKSTKCESVYMAMLADVSPGGQYCQYTTGGGASNGTPTPPAATFMPWTFPLSILREWNQLPRKAAMQTTFGINAFAYSNSGINIYWQPNWRNPYNKNVTDDPATVGNEQFSYLNANDEIELIQVTPDGAGNYTPRVHFNNLGKVQANPNDPNDGTLWVQPRYLNSAEDFKNAWKPSWGQSLVYIHPEYELYERCLLDNASNDFDSEMSLPATMADVQAIPSHQTQQLFNPVGNMPGGTTSVNDPYFAPASSNTPAGFGNVELANIQTAMLNYMPKPNTNPVEYYTIWEAVWIMQNCPNANGPLTACQCTLPTSSTLSTNEQWQIFQPLYLSLKQAIQDRRNMLYAIDGNQSAYNGCIGNQQFNPFQYGFYTFMASPLTNNYWANIWNNWAPWPSGNPSQYFNHEQPCNTWTKNLYKEKVARFATSNQILSSASSTFANQPCYDENGLVIPCPPLDAAALEALQDQAALANYQNCKQCPEAANLESLLSGLAQIETVTAQKDLTSTAPVLLSCYPASKHNEFIPDLHLAMGFAASDEVSFAFNNTNTTINIGGVSRNYFEGTFTATGSNPSNQSCNLRLVFPHKIIDQPGALPSQINPQPFTNAYNFSDITDICCLVFSPFSSFSNGVGNFKCQATVLVRDNANDPLYIPGVVQYRNIELNGDISCLNLRDCSFQPVCATSNEANDFLNLMNALLFKVPQTPPIATANFFSTGVSLSTEPYNAFLSEELVTQLGGVSTPALTAFTWNHLSSVDNVFNASISGGTNPCNITITVNNTVVDAANIVKLFSIKPIVGGAPGDFSALALVRNGSTLSYEKVTGNAPCINIGSCSSEITSEAFSGQSSTYNLDVMCPASDGKNAPGQSGFALFIKDPTTISLMHASPSQYYRSNSAGYSVLDNGGNACSLTLNFPPNPNGYTLAQISSVEEIYGDPAYLTSNTPSTSYFLLNVIMNDGTHMTLNGNAPCESIYGCIGTNFSVCNPIDVVKNGNFNLGRTEYDSDFSSSTTPIAGVSDHTNCGDLMIPTCTTGAYMSFVISTGTNAFTAWKQDVLLFPNTDYTFKFSHASIKSQNLMFEVYIDAATTPIRTIHCFPSNPPCGGAFSVLTDRWYNETEFFDAIDLNLTSSGNHTIALRVLTDDGSRFMLDDISLTYCGSPNSYMCTLPPPVEEIEVPDDCIENALNNAVEGAQNEYAEYIEEQRIEFKNAYKRHCLDVYEKFEMKYPDTEHHYTLYYYDQAGNLERTVPPNGVVKITDADQLQQIGIDRAEGTRTVFTNHSYTTTYNYNSLNQLVSQSMPDHQDMNISGSTTLNGINPAHNVQSITFNGTSGLALANNGSTGYIYSYNPTPPGSWQQLTGLSVNNLNDVLFIDPSTAFVAGDNGTVLHTVDAGLTWQLLPFPNTTGNLIRLHKVAGVNEVVVYDNKGSKWTSSANGTNWTTPSVAFLLNPTEIISDIDVDKASGDGWAITSEGRIFKANVYASSSWTAVTPAFETVDLNSVAHNGTDFYAFGKDGTVLKSTNATTLTDWQEIESNVNPSANNPNFKQVIFTSAVNAIALDDLGNVLISNDAAVTWAPSSPGNETVVQLSRLAGAGAYAITSTGKLYYHDGNAWGNSILASSVTGASSLFMTAVATGYIGDSNGNLYTVTQNTTTNVVSAVQTFTAPLNGGIKEMYFTAFNDGYILTNSTSSQNIYHFTGGSSPTAVLSGVSGDIYTHLNGNGNTIYAINATGSAVGVSSTTITPITNISGATNLNSFGFASNNSQTIVVGNDGQIYPFSGTGTEFNTPVNTVNVHVPTLTTISAIDATSALAAGNDGTVVKTSNGGANWQTFITNDNSNLKDISNNGTSLMAAGNTSLIANANQFVYGTIASSAFSTLPNSLNKNIKKTYCDAGNAYLVGDNAALSVSLSTALTNTISISGNLVGISETANDFLVVGDAGKIYHGAFGSLTLQNNFVPPVLNDVKYFDANHAISVGNGGSILVTSNAGINWQTLAITNGTGQDLNAITMVSSTQAYAVGNSGTLVSLNLNGSTYTANSLSGLGLSGDIKDIEYSTGYYLAASSDGKIYQTNNITNGFTPSNNFGAPLNAITNKNGHFACAVGNNGVIVTGARGFGAADPFVFTASTNNGPTWSAYLTGTANNQQDVYFIDYNTGYVAGENGLVLKTINGGDSWTLENYSNLPSTNLNTIVAAPAGSLSTYLVAGNNGASVSVSDQKNEFSTRMYYDKLGRLVASQNSKQFAKNPLTYSYTIYDGLGRISEVGEYIASVRIDQLSGTINGQISLTEFTNWLGAATQNKTQVTRTFYDEPTSITIPGFTQNSFNLRNRVSHAIFYDNLNRTGFTSNYEHAAYYEYDIHGNVKTLVQHNPYLAGDNEFKRIDYDYDLISGKVNEVVYQKGFKDEFHHRYEYDADNRITNVYTSSDGVLWDQDAKYFYYKHGPLARTETGDLKVQGTDYAYTLHGWIKGVNSTSLNAANDIGADANVAETTNVNKNLAQDKFGYSLEYFNGDYIAKAVSNVSFIPNQGVITTNNTDLFNGNISNMSTTITKQNGDVDPLASVYTYDQLNRIKTANKYSGFDFVNNSWATASLSNAYHEDFAYDANGNITILHRNDNAGTMLDNLSYNYETIGNGYAKNTNKLGGVDEAAGSTIPTDDIEDQDFSATNHTANNYQYDEIGNLIKDKSECIENIEWTVYGKIKKITRITGCVKDPAHPDNFPSDLEFMYDASGNRIAKIEKKRDVNGVKAQTDWVYTYYSRDAQGNVMAVYDVNSLNHSNSSNLFLTEQHLYGSSRLGMKRTDIDMGGSILANAGEYKRTLGQKSYEYSNHLGNVLTVVSDRKIPVDNNADNIVDYYTSEVLSASDYYAFGGKLNLRGFTGDYRYGFNGKETDPENNGTQDYGMRIYNPELGRFLSVDPMANLFPWWSSYHFAGNTPIQASDLDGEEINFKQHFKAMQVNAAQFFINGGTHQKMVEATFVSNEVAKMNHDYMGQMNIGTARYFSSLLDGAGLLITMGGWDGAKWPQGYYGSPCGMPWNKNHDGTVGIQFYEFDPIKADVDKVINGDIATKTEGVLGLASWLIPPVAEESLPAKTITSMSQRIFVASEDGYAVIRDNLGAVVGRGSVMNGELDLVIKTKGTNLQGMGGDVFRNLYRYVDNQFDQVKAIKGVWQKGQYSDNLKTFLKNVGDGSEQSMKNAAFETFTGKQAKKLGFSNVEITNIVKDEISGEVLSVEVKFLKDSK